MQRSFEEHLVHMNIADIEATFDQLRKLLLQQRFYLPLTILLVLALIIGHRAADPDLFARLAVGKQVIEHGTVSLVDDFAFSPKKPLFIDHEWLSGVWFYTLQTAGGEWMFFAYKFLAALCTILLLHQATRLYAGKVVLPWFLLALICASYIWLSTVRSQVLTYLLLPMFIYGIELVRLRKAKLPLMVLPLLMIIWVNAHGGFILGVAVVGAFATGALIENLRYRFEALTLCILTVAATMVTPYPAAVFWGYIFEALTMPRPTITEWAPLVISEPGSLPILSVMLLVVLGLRCIKKRPPLYALALLGMGIFGALRHARLMAFLAIVACVYGQPLYEAAIHRLWAWMRPRDLLLKRSAVIALVLLASSSATHIIRTIASEPLKLSLDTYPVNAISWLKDRGNGGNLLIDFNNGSFAIWNLYPRYRVSLDGRYEEVYPQATVNMVTNALVPSTPVHLEDFEKLHPDYAIITASHAKQFQEMHPTWCTLTMDSQYHLFGQGPC